MSEKEVLALVVTKILNKTDSEILDQIYEKVGEDIVLKENAGDIILNLYAEKAKAQKQELTDKFNQGVQKNDKETASELKERLEEDYGFKTDKIIRKEIYDEFKEFLGSPLGTIMLGGWSLAMYYHLCNGIRHLFWDFGKGFELKNATRSGITVIVTAVVLTALTWLKGLGII